jgi:hypothetical protein
MDFADVVNQLGKIAGNLKFEPIWKPYKGENPIWIACEGLTFRDALIAFDWMEALLKTSETEYRTFDAWNIESLSQWKKEIKGVLKEPLKSKEAILTLGSPLFRLAYASNFSEWNAYRGKGLWNAEKESCLEGCYKILCYASNTSHFAVTHDKNHEEAELVEIHKKQKAMMWRNEGDFDLQLELSLTEGASLEFKEECLRLDMERQAKGE